MLHKGYIGMLLHLEMGRYVDNSGFDKLGFVMTHKRILSTFISLTLDH